mgnify:CR=1 FL=1
MPERCAIVGGGLAGLVAYAALRHGGLTPTEIAVFGTDLNTNLNYYLSPDHVNNGIPALQQTSFAPSSSTPNEPLVSSNPLTQWKDASKNWGSNLAFPVPAQESDGPARLLRKVQASRMASWSGSPQLSLG